MKMSFIEYLLIGVLGITGSFNVMTPRTLDAGAINEPRAGTTVQPTSESGLLQDTGGDKARNTAMGKKPTKSKTKRSHKRHHHQSGAQPDAFTVKQKASNTSHQ